MPAGGTGGIQLRLFIDREVHDFQDLLDAVRAGIGQHLREWRAFSPAEGRERESKGEESLYV